MSTKPIPWLPAKAVLFLEEFLTKDMNILEFGSGESTKWFADRVGHIDSVETDPKWIVRAMELEQRYDNIRIIHGDTHYCLESGVYDFVLVDGRNRVRTFAQGLCGLKKGGVIMLDNSEREEYKDIFDMMRVYGKSVDSCYGGALNGWTYEGWECTWWWTI